MTVFSFIFAVDVLRRLFHLVFYFSTFSFYFIYFVFIFFFFCLAKGKEKLILLLFFPHIFLLFSINFAEFKWVCVVNKVKRQNWQKWRYWIVIMINILWLFSEIICLNFMNISFCLTKKENEKQKIIESS